MGVLDRIGVRVERLHPHDRWCLDIPAIAHLVEHGLELDPVMTVVVGENGAGKSTFVESLAASWGGSLHSKVEHWGPPPSGEDSSLARCLQLDGEWPRPSGGCFLRAEAMHAMFGDVDSDEFVADRVFEGKLNTRSHGESFLAYLDSRVAEHGLFVLDEPEAALSFASCLRLLALLDALTDRGSQVVLATHSPLLAAFPGATLLEFGEWGIRRAEWADLDLVNDWRTFLDDPQLFLRHLF